jgi:UDP-N-acetylmuramate--alanine ligase
MELQAIKSVYFVGIGGIGMSALARYFNSRGASVSGYDRTETLLTKKLVEEGIDIHYEEDLSQIPQQLDLVVYTPAIPSEHEELKFLKSSGLPVKKRAEVLGIISRGMKAIAIAGTHGKTSTTTMLTYLLKEGGVDCNAFLGGIALDFDNNFVEGKSEWVVVEADEYDRSFLHLHPTLAVILSMDADHLDIYGDLESLHETGFRAFARNLHPDGQLYIHHQWKAALGPVEGVKSYGCEEGEVQVQNLRVEEGYFTFDYQHPEVRLEGLQLSMPGQHNVENAAVAITIALKLGVDPADIRRALRSFRGIRRRFEFLYRKEGIAYIDDYAHHPSELRAAISAARQLYPNKRIVGVFQPHLYSRTRDFAPGFSEALDLLDKVLLLPIYPARELPIEGVRSEMLLDAMKSSHKQLVEKPGLMQAIEEEQPEILLTLGAGDIDNFREPIKKYYEKTYA